MRNGRHDGTARAESSGASREKVFAGGSIESVDIRGFKSLEDVSLPLSSVNILVGANGTGKSNVLGFFDMLGSMVQWTNLQGYIGGKGGGDGLLFNGAKHTPQMSAKLSLKARGKLEYRFTLRHTDDNRLAFAQEQFQAAADKADAGHWYDLGKGHDEAKITVMRMMPLYSIRQTLRGCGVVYQFKDTSSASPLRLPGNEDDFLFLRDNGSNLAPVLHDLKMRTPSNYEDIVGILRKVVPAFHDFELEPADGKVALRWQHKDKKMLMGAHLTSDGALRFMALVTLLNMPMGRIPNIVLLDEPELGLHPYAIWLLGALIQRLGIDKQIIVTTQSPLLLNEFDPEQIVVTEMDEQGATSFRRLVKKDLQHWLDEFKLGELWQKNVIGGNP